MSLCIVRTPQDDDNSLPELLARSGAPASGRAQGPDAKSLCVVGLAWMLLAFAGIGAVGMARIVAVAVVIVGTTITSVTVTRAIIIGTA